MKSGAREKAVIRQSLTVPHSLPAVVASVFLLIAWESGVAIFQVPAYIVPTPTAVAVRIYEDFSSGVIYSHFWLTLVEVILGFVVATIFGVGIGTAVALIPILDRTTYPILLALQAVPKVAIAPLLIIWFGYGMHSKVVMGALIAFFPILVNVIAGLKTTDSRRVLLMKALRARPIQIYMKVRLPSMLPYLFAGLEVGIVFALIGAIVGEFVGSSVGLGSLIIQRQAVVDVAGVFSVLFYLSVMGMVMSMGVKTAADRLTFWSRTIELTNV